MSCQVCGVGVMPGQRFCSACGTRVSRQPPPIGTAGYASQTAATAAIARVPRHLQILGILWCAYGGLRLIMGLVGMFFLRTFVFRRFGSEGWPFGGSAHPFPPTTHPFPEVLMNTILPTIAVVTLLATLLALLTGFALLTRKPWGRTLAIIAAVLTLIKIPLGTALGIYTLWVLAPAQSAAEYRALAEQTN